MYYHNNMENMTTLGERIRALRKKKELTLDQLAENSGVSKAYLSQLENGQSERPSAENLYNISTSLDVTIASLLGKELKYVKKDNNTDDAPNGLKEAIRKNKWTNEDIEPLLSIAMRSQKGQAMTADDWTYLHETIKRVIE